MLLGACQWDLHKLRINRNTSQIWISRQEGDRSANSSRFNRTFLLRVDFTQPYKSFSIIRFHILYTAWYILKANALVLTGEIKDSLRASKVSSIAAILCKFFMIPLGRSDFFCNLVRAVLFQEKIDCGIWGWRTLFKFCFAICFTS